jgi:hypothetical protein
VLPELRRLLADPPGRPAAVTLPALAAGFRRLLADYLAARVAAGDPARLTAIFDRFERWSTARATLQVLTLLSVTSALIASIAGT